MAAVAWPFTKVKRRLPVCQLVIQAINSPFDGIMVSRNNLMALASGLAVAVIWALLTVRKPLLPKYYR